MIDRAMTVREVAEYLNVDQKVIYRLLNTGSLPGFKVAGTWRFKRADIDSWIEERKQLSVPVEKARAATATNPVLPGDLSEAPLAPSQNHEVTC